MTVRPYTWTTDRPAIERESAENLSTSSHTRRDRLRDLYVRIDGGAQRCPRAPPWRRQSFGLDVEDVSIRAGRAELPTDLAEFCGLRLGDLWSSSSSGVPNVVIPDAVFKDPRELVSFLAEHRVTRIVLVPSWLRA